MKLEYYKETNSLYIDLSPRASTESQEVADGIVIDLDEKGDIVGIDIQHASEKLDLSSVEAVALPARAVKVG